MVVTILYRLALGPLGGLISFEAGLSFLFWPTFPTRELILQQLDCFCTALPAISRTLNFFKVFLYRIPHTTPIHVAIQIHFRNLRRFSYMHVPSYLSDFHQSRAGFQVRLISSHNFPRSLPVAI